MKQVAESFILIAGIMLVSVACGLYKGEIRSEALTDGRFYAGFFVLVLFCCGLYNVFHSIAQWIADRIRKGIAK